MTEVDKMFGWSRALFTPFGVFIFKSPRAEPLFSERYGHRKVLVQFRGWRVLWRSN